MMLCICHLIFIIFCYFTQQVSQALRVHLVLLELKVSEANQDYQVPICQGPKVRGAHLVRQVSS